MGAVVSLSSCTIVLGIDDLSPADPDASVDAEAPTKEGGSVDATLADDAGPGADATAADVSTADVEVARTIPVIVQDSVVGIPPLGALYGSDLRFGEALAFSPDGTWLAIGAPGAARSDSDAGATGQVQLVNISLEPGHAGTLFVSLLDPGGADPAPGASFGRSLAFSPDGRYLAVGAPQEPHTVTISGDVYLYALTSNGWSYQATLEPDNRSATWFGNTVAFNAPAFTTPPPDDVLFVAATGDTTEQDAGKSATSACVSAYLFTDAGVESKAYGTVTSPYQQDGFGWSLAVTSDAGVVLIGAPFPGVPAYVSGLVYVTSLANLGPDAGLADGNYPYAYSDMQSSLFGYSLALTVDGSEVLIGAPRDGGVVSSLELNAVAPPSFGNFSGPFTDPDFDGGRFGECVVANTQRAIIGDPARDDGVCLMGSLPASGLAVSPLKDAPDPIPASGSRYGATLATTYDGAFVAIAAPGTQGTPPPVVYLTR